MKLFRSYTFSWWQMGVFKLALFSIGVLVGSHFSEWFVAQLFWIALIAILSSVYILFVSLKQ